MRPLGVVRNSKRPEWRLVLLIRTMKEFWKTWSQTGVEPEKSALAEPITYFRADYATVRRGLVTEL